MQCIRTKCGPHTCTRWTDFSRSSPWIYKLTQCMQVKCDECYVLGLKLRSSGVQFLESCLYSKTSCPSEVANFDGKSWRDDSKWKSKLSVCLFAGTAALPKVPGEFDFHRRRSFTEIIVYVLIAFPCSNQCLGNYLQIPCDRNQNRTSVKKLA